MIQYTFSYTKPHRHFIDIEMRIFEHSSPELIVQLPAGDPEDMSLAILQRTSNILKCLILKGIL